MNYKGPCWVLAMSWARVSGNQCDATMIRLVERLEDCIHDFESDLDNEDAVSGEGGA